MIVIVQNFVPLALRHLLPPWSLSPIPERRYSLTAHHLPVARARCELPSNAPPVGVFTVQDQRRSCFIPGATQLNLF
jgi:hypothetical protein